MASKRVQSIIRKILTLHTDEKQELIKQLLIETGKPVSEDDSPVSEEENMRLFLEAAGSWSNIPESIIDEIYAQRSVRTRPEIKL